jgi:hypothetical protein
MKYLLFLVLGVILSCLLVVALAAASVVSPLVLIYFLYNRYLDHKEEMSFDDQPFDDQPVKVSRLANTIEQSLRDSFKVV